MLSWAFVAFIAAIVAAIHGFAEVSTGVHATIAQLAFAVFLALWLFLLVAGLLRRP